jgi:hypothetical protein
MFYDIYTLTIVVEVYNGTRIKQAMNLLSRTLNWSNESHWEWATKPNPREASFV